VSALGPEHPAVVAMLEANEGLMKPVLRFGGNGRGRIATHTTLKGPFTVEAWVRMPGPIDNNDGLMGHQGGPDFNFAGGQLRVYGGDGAGDIVISERVTRPDTWTHCAITRDAANKFHIYLDGEPDPAESREFGDDLVDFNVGETHRGQDTDAAFDEFRVWNVCRSDEEIRREYRTALDAAASAGLVLRLTGEQPGAPMEGSARTGMTMDFPALVTPAEAVARAAKFDRYRALAGKPGDAAKGRGLFQASCMICHQVGGEGIAIGPNLNGAGAMGTEALLRNVLTPNAQLESGYYRHDLKTRDGDLVSGFLAGETDAAVTLRIIGGGEKTIPRSEIVSHEISRRTLMPEGLLDGFSEAQVSDLFSYLNTLR
jgi:putative heme-binding domain-containing protein